MPLRAIAILVLTSSAVLAAETAPAPADADTRKIQFILSNAEALKLTAEQQGQLTANLKALTAEREKLQADAPTQTLYRDLTAARKANDNDKAAAINQKLRARRAELGLTEPVKSGARLLDVLTDEQRKTLQHLMQLHRSANVVGPSPSPQPEKQPQ